MATVKSYEVGSGDMFYIRHNSDNFTIIDCDLGKDNADDIISDLKNASAEKGISRFICTHPDEDHFGGIHLLDAKLPISNFYVVKNQAIKDDETDSFKHYCKLRDGDKAFHISKGCTRRWMNLSNDERQTSGIQILWPDTENKYFKEALSAAALGISFNNTSAVVRYKVKDGASFLWLGDLETEFMEAIANSIDLEKTTVVFASHHGRKSGKIPDSWLKILDPQIIVIGEAPWRHLHYYTGYHTITQNSAGNITMDAVGNKVHFYVANENYTDDFFTDEKQSKHANYIGSITVETEYTL